VGEGAAAATCPGNEAYSRRGLYPLGWCKHKTVQSGPISKPLEFEGFEIRVVQGLPYPQEFNRVAIAHPILDYMVGPIWLSMLCDVGDGDVVLLCVGKHRNLCPFNIYDRFPWFAHGISYAAN
jgi:hypothetical protein